MDELIKTLREHAEWAEANQWEVPITLADDLRKAADELDKAREIVVLWDMYGGSEGITDAFERAEKARWIPVEERLPEDFEEVWAACKMDGCENWTIQTVYDPWLSCPWGGIPVLESGKAHVYAWMPNDPSAPPEEDKV